MIYALPTIANITYPPTTQVWNYIRSAENDIEISRDQRGLMALLKRMTVANPRIAGHILTRQTAITSYEWDIHDEKKKLEEAETALKQFISAILQNYVRVPVYGVFALQYKWALANNMQVPVVGKIYDPTELENYRGDVCYYEWESTNAPLVRNQLPDSCIVATDGQTQPGGALRSVVFHDLLRHDALTEWSNFNKKLKGIVQGKANEDEKADAAEALRTIALNNYALTSKDVEFLFNEMTSSKGVDSFTAFIDAVNNDIAIALLGQANTTQLPNNGGSRAAVQVQNLIRADIHYSDMQAVTELINKQVLLPFYRMNYEAGAETCPLEFSFKHDDAGDVEANARVIEILIRAGVPISESELYKKIGFTPPKADEPVFSPKSAPAFV